MKDKIFNKITNLSSNIKTDKITENASFLKDNVTDAFGKIKDYSTYSLEAFTDSKFLEETLNTLSNAKDTVFYYGENLVGLIISDQTVYKAFIDYFERFHTHIRENPEIQKVIDDLAHVEGYGGGMYHRIADGRHSIPGAFEAVSKELPNAEFMEKVSGTFQHLWSDFHSTTGIPLFSFDNYGQFKSFCEFLHLPVNTVQDFLCVNSTELLGSALCIFPVIYNFNEMQAVDFAKVAARIGVLTIGGTQFGALSSLFALSMLGKAFFDTIHEGEPITGILKEATIEGGWTGASLATICILPFPFSIVGVVLLVGLKSQVESNGFEAVIENYKDQYDSVFEWIKDEGISTLKSVTNF